MQDMETGLFESEQIGSFFSFAKATDEFGVSLIGEARIPKRNQVLCETLLMGGLYYYLFLRGRYLIHRVDMGLWFAVAAILLRLA